MDFPPPALLLYELAAGEARSANSGVIDTAHLMLAAAKLADIPLNEWFAESLPAALRVIFVKDQREIAAAFQRAEVPPRDFRRRLRFELHRVGESQFAAEGVGDGILHRTAPARRAFEQVFEASRDSFPLAVQVLRQVAAEPDPFWLEVWNEFSARNPIQALFGVGDDGTESPILKKEAQPKSAQPKSAQPKSARATTPTLDRYGRDLTALAHDGQLAPVWGRDAEVVRLAQILASARKGNALLVGEAGVGKTAIVEGLAQRLTARNLPPGLAGLRLIEIQLSSLLAGASYRGQWEERLQKLLQEAAAPGVILFFDEIHTLVGAGGHGVSDAAQVFKPALARGAVRIIGATTGSEYANSIERDAALERRFETLWIEEPTREMALEVLRGARSKLEKHHEVTFSDNSLEAAVELSIRFLPDLRLPDKALDALDGAASAVRFRTLSPSPSAELSITIEKEDVAAVIARRARIPLENALCSDAQRLLSLEEALRGAVKGQDNAISRVSNALKLSFSGFKTPGKPHGVFLFAGASGSGKTLLAKNLALSLYGEERALHRFDMSEYAEAHTVSRLLGAPPGYIGHDQEGALSKALRERPACVVLFDEIEKAHPDVWNIWLQIFDEGHLTDARGRRLDFSESIVVLTSNLGVQVVKNRVLGFRAHEKSKPLDRISRIEEQEFERSVLDAIQKTLRPELVGRISEILVFPPLDAAAQRQVVEQALHVIAERGQIQGITLQWDEEVLTSLCETGFSEQTGARPLAREIEKRVALPLAEALLRKRIAAGDIWRLSLVNGGLAFEAISSLRGGCLDPATPT